MWNHMQNAGHGYGQRGGYNQNHDNDLMRNRYDHRPPAPPHQQQYGDQMNNQSNYYQMPHMMQHQQQGYSQNPMQQQMMMRMRPPGQQTDYNMMPPHNSYQNNPRPPAPPLPVPPPPREQPPMPPEEPKPVPPPNEPAPPPPKEPEPVPRPPASTELQHEKSASAYAKGPCADKRQLQWWKSELTQLNTDVLRDGLKRLTQEDWFLRLTESQQKECWSHKKNLVSKKSKTPSSSSAPASTTIAAPKSTLPSTSNTQASVHKSLAAIANTGSLEDQLKAADELLQNLHKQDKTFDEQYNKWKHQFDEWKSKHAAHPNKQQFEKYAHQWKTWQEQMLKQKRENNEGIAKARKVIAEIKAKLTTSKAVSSLLTTKYSVNSAPTVNEGPVRYTQPTQPKVQPQLNSPNFNTPRPSAANVPTSENNFKFFTQNHPQKNNVNESSFLNSGFANQRPGFNKTAQQQAAKGMESYTSDDFYNTYSDEFEMDTTDVSQQFMPRAQAPRMQRGRGRGGAQRGFGQPRHPTPNMNKTAATNIAQADGNSSFQTGSEDLNNLQFNEADAYELGQGAEDLLLNDAYENDLLSQFPEDPNTMPIGNLRNFSHNQNSQKSFRGRGNFRGNFSNVRQTVPQLNTLRQQNPILQNQRQRFPRAQMPFSSATGMNMRGLRGGTPRGRGAPKLPPLRGTGGNYYPNELPPMLDDEKEEYTKQLLQRLNQLEREREDLARGIKTGIIPSAAEAALADKKKQPESKAETSKNVDPTVVLNKVKDISSLDLQNILSAVKTVKPGSSDMNQSSEDLQQNPDKEASESSGGGKSNEEKYGADLLDELMNDPITLQNQQIERELLRKKLMEKQAMLRDTVEYQSVVKKVETVDYGHGRNMVRNEDLRMKYIDDQQRDVERERRSLSRERHSMERQKQRLDQNLRQDEKYGEKSKRDSSLERLRKLEDDLREKERTLNKRQDELHVMLRRGVGGGRPRDTRDWLPEGRLPPDKRQPRYRSRSPQRQSPPRHGFPPDRFRPPPLDRHELDDERITNRGFRWSPRRSPPPPHSRSPPSHHSRSPPQRGRSPPPRGRSPPPRGRSPPMGRSPPPRGRSPPPRGRLSPRGRSPPPMGRSPLPHSRSPPPHQQAEEEYFVIDENTGQPILVDQLLDRQKRQERISVLEGEEREKRKNYERARQRERDMIKRDREIREKRERDARDRRREREKRERMRRTPTPEIKKGPDRFGRERDISASNNGQSAKVAPPQQLVRNIGADFTAVTISVEDILNDPARQKRPRKIVIILRGLPGSGKSHIAKLIRDHEASKGITPRVLSLDDYFMNEKMEYEYEKELEESYRESLFRSFKKTLEDGYFVFVIVDAINNKVQHFSELWTIAKKNGFEVYIAELTQDIEVCEKRNVHHRKLDDLKELQTTWEKTPPHMIKLDLRQMTQNSEIQEVEMGDVSDEAEVVENPEEVVSQEDIPKSKWEKMETTKKLDKLDGIKKHKAMPHSMDDFLSVTDDYIERHSEPGKKRVRWADIEEKKSQQRMRDVGFVVGKTDWDRMMNDSHADRALNRTKFI